MQWLQIDFRFALCNRSTVPREISEISTVLFEWDYLGVSPAVLRRLSEGARLQRLVER